MNQQMLTDLIAQLFRNPHEAKAFATEPMTYIGERVGDADTSTLDMATDLADINISRPMLELIELGVKARLMMDDEIGHSARNAQDEPRRNQDVQPGEALNVAQMMLQRYERRRNIEVRRLRTSYPFQAW